MIKILVSIAYEQNRPMSVASALRIQFGFWAKSALKMHCTKMFLRQKLLQITIRNFWCKDFFDRPKGVASALIAQFGFLVKSALKMRCAKLFYQTKVVTNQNLQLLCYVRFFDILHHYGVIAASQICSASRKYCAVLRNRFFYSGSVPGKELSFNQFWCLSYSYLFIYLFIYLFMVAHLLVQALVGLRWYLLKTRHGSSFKFIIRRKRSFPRILFSVASVFFFFFFYFLDKYCIGPKNRNRDFDESSRFECYRVQKKVIFWHVICLCVCLAVYTITQKIIELSQLNLVCDFT